MQLALQTDILVVFLLVTIGENSRRDRLLSCPGIVTHREILSCGLD